MLADDGPLGWRWPQRLCVVRRSWAALGRGGRGPKMTGKRVLGIVLAGGAGMRLAPLTAERAKAAVPFGGLYRVVDFALSNLVNGGIRRICVLTQYKSYSLDRHLATAWRLSSLLGDYVTPVPAQQWLGPHWQPGSADAIFQSLSVIYKDQPDLVAVCGADHVYRMDPVQMIGQHTAWGAGVTVAATGVPRAEATGLGVVQTAAGGHRIEEFTESPPTRRAALATRVRRSRPWAATYSTLTC
jgi:glucose-1-phosphate adenylyltransferase